MPCKEEISPGSSIMNAGKSTRYEIIKSELMAKPKIWLITGVAGFIGSNLLETLLKLNQYVVGLDNFSTGYQHNLDEVKNEVSLEQWSRFHFIKGDIRNENDCRSAMYHPLSYKTKERDVNHLAVGANVDYVLHQAALGSVPRSIADPIATNATNITGFLNMLVAARDAETASFTYASSSSTYGDHPALPKIEENVGNFLSPYAVTKYLNELYADVFTRTYGFKANGLRYFNVFGKRQDPHGAYAAVIPKWISSMIKGDKVFINGDGESSRDFCHIENTVQMNILSATASYESMNNVYNVAVGERVSLNTLFSTLKETLSDCGLSYTRPAFYRDFRVGDVRHSQADIRKAKDKLSYCPSCCIYEGIEKTVPWYISKYLNK